MKIIANWDYRDLNTTLLNKYKFIDGVCVIKNLPDNDKAFFVKKGFKIEEEEVKIGNLVKP